MMQQGFVWNGSSMVSIDLPDKAMEVIPGVRWGSVDAFPSPAYWKYQVLARRIQNEQIQFKLGRTLAEEVGACLLGGHGIPASVGLVAYAHLKTHGVFSGTVVEESQLFVLLSEPIRHGEKTIRYRFAKQKSCYLAAALAKLASELAPTGSGQLLRNWLLDVPGIGYKTASWIARNWLGADDVAILDIHILRAGQLGRFFKDGLTVDRHYLQLEDQFLAFSHGLGVAASELDAVIWHEMMLSPRTVHQTLGAASLPRKNSSRGKPRTKQRHTNPDQLPLAI